MSDRFTFCVYGVAGMILPVAECCAVVLIEFIACSVCALCEDMAGAKMG